MACEKPDWFKMDPSKFLSDGLIDAMTAEEFGATMRLLLRQWIDGYIADDLAILARQCRMTLERMKSVWPMVSRYFPKIEVGKRANRFMWCERAVVMAEFERKQLVGRKAVEKRWADERARKSNENRSAIGDLENSHTNAIQDIDIDIDKEQVQKPSRAKAARATKTALADERHTAFKAAIKAYWDSKNPGVEMPWGPMEGKQLGMWLREAPHITLEQFTGFLRCRFKSDVNHGERPSQWIRWITSYGNGPIDRYGKPLQENGNGTSKPSATHQRVDANRAALAKAAERFGWSSPDETGSANGGALPEPRSDGQPGGVLVGFPATGASVLASGSASGAGGIADSPRAGVLSSAG
jgi:uncharacterized protein YdaU (DUF1376 family)